MRITTVAMIVVALCATGCSKNIFFGSAPAKTGWMYVVGARNDRAYAWLCPTVPGRGQCHEIDVVEVEQ